MDVPKKTFSISCLFLNHWLENLPITMMICHHQKTSYETNINDIPCGRTNHSTIVYNNRLITFGGYNSACLSSLYELNLTTKKWKKLVPTLRQFSPSERYAHTAVLYKDYMIIFGGFNGWYLNTTHKFGFEKCQWSLVGEKSNAPLRRAHHTAVLYGNKMIVFGGVSSNEKYLNDVWELDLETEKWSLCLNKGNVPPPRGGHTSSLYKQEILTIGGYCGKLCSDSNDIYSYDVITHRWTKKPSGGERISGRYGHTTVVVHDYLYLFGGFDGHDHLNDFYQLSLKNYQWKRITFEGVVPSVRAWHCMVSNNESDLIYLFGGQSSMANNSKTLNDLYSVWVPSKIDMRLIEVHEKRAFVDVVIEISSKKRKRESEILSNKKRKFLLEKQGD